MESEISGEHFIYVNSAIGAVIVSAGTEEGKAHTQAASMEESLSNKGGLVVMSFGISLLCKLCKN